jgi:hypothetical protein
MEYTSNSPQETFALGKRLGDSKAGRGVCLDAIWEWARLFLPRACSRTRN